MKWCVFFLRISGVLLAALLCAGCGKDNSARNPSAMPRWQSWPVHIQTDAFPGLNALNAQADLNAAVQFWNQYAAARYPGLVAIAIDGAGMPAVANSVFQDPNADLPATGLLHLGNWPFGASRIGNTVRTTDANNWIAHAISAINTQDYSFCHGSCGTPGTNAYRRVLAHELGHLLGIEAHSLDPQNIMYDGEYHVGDLTQLIVDDANLQTLFP